MDQASTHLLLDQNPFPIDGLSRGLGGGAVPRLEPASLAPEAPATDWVPWGCEPGASSGGDTLRRVA